MKENKMTNEKQRKLETTIEQLDKQVRPARPNMKPSTRTLYQNEETGTVVYEVITDNLTLPYQIHEHIVWSEYLVGNNDGYTTGGFHVKSEANFMLGEIIEDDEKVIIPQNGSYTGYAGFQFEAEDICVKKEKLTPYDQEENNEGE